MTRMNADDRGEAKNLDDGLNNSVSDRPRLWKRFTNRLSTMACSDVS